MRPARMIDFADPAFREMSLNDTRPPDNALSWQLWQACGDLAQMALESDYVQGIAAGNLDPDQYCHYTIQDLAYSYNGLKDCVVANARAVQLRQPEIQTFTSARLGRLNKSIEDAKSALYISDPTAVVPGDATQGYIQFESGVAATLDPVYYIVAATPCLQLWAWLTSELMPDATPGNIYRNWITSNNDWSGAYTLDNFVDAWFAANGGGSGWETALGVYRGCMTGEVNFFRAACGQPLIPFPLIPKG